MMLLRKALQEFTASHYSRPASARRPGHGGALSLPSAPMKLPNSDWTHEWSHGVALLASGYRVSRLAVADGSGKCDPSGNICPRVLRLCAAAGAVGEAMFTGAGKPGDGDELTFAETLEGCDPKTWPAIAAAAVAEAHQLLLKHREAVLFGVRESEGKSVIGEREFADLCHRSGSPLKFAAAWYPAKHVPDALDRKMFAAIDRLAGKPGRRSLGYQNVECQSGIF